MSKFSIILLLLIPFLCKSQTKTQYKYLFTAHTYAGESILDYRLQNLDKSTYDNIWLGGDIYSETLMLRSNLATLNSLLGVGEPHNYFSLGNHDRRNGNLEYFEQFIGTKAYYADYYNGFTAIVTDSNLDPSDCENLNAQYEMICNVCDTITQSSHLIMFFHWGLWSGVPGIDAPSSFAHTDLKYWNANCDSTNNNFKSLIYPKLVEVQERGVQVICIMGDMGASCKKYEGESNDSIIFLGCGLDNIKYQYEPEQWWAKEKDLILEFNHNIEAKELTWVFRDIDSLIDVQNGFRYLTKLTFDDHQSYPAEHMYSLNCDTYYYSMSGTNDTLAVLNQSTADIHSADNIITFEGVFKSLSAGGGLSVIVKLIKNEEIVEEIITPITDIPTSMKFFSIQFTPETDIELTDSVEISIINLYDVDILINNVVVKYKPI